MGTLSGEAILPFSFIPLIFDWSQFLKPRSKFYPLSVDLIREDFVIQGGKQEITKSAPFVKMAEKTEKYPYTIALNISL